MSFVSHVPSNSSLKKIAALSLLSASIGAIALPSAIAQESNITFGDILTNPDDRDLNIAYAKQEAKTGNLLAAAATLERLLLNDPNMDDARLFYAAVLYRMGDYQSANREIRVLESRPLSAGLKADLENFKAKVTTKQKKSSLSGSLSLGYTYDDHVAANLAENNVPVGDDADDTAFTARLRAKYVYDFDNTYDLKFIAVVNTFSKMYEDFDQVDFNFVSTQVGFTGAKGPYDWRVTLNGRNLDVAGDQYLKEYGITGRLRRELTPRTSLQGQLTLADQDYDNIVIGSRPTTQEDLRSGNKYTGSLSLQHKFSGSVRGSLDVGLVKKEADYDPYANDAKFVRGAISKKFTNGSYATANYIYRDVEFDAVDPLVISGGTAPREEDRHFARAALGTPLSNIFKTERANLKKTLQNVSVEASVFHDDRQANYDQYDYENTGVELKFSWRFDQ